MNNRETRKRLIKQFILEHVLANPRTISKLVADTFSISRTAANTHIQNLVEEGMLRFEGKTSDRRYYPVVFPDILEFEKALTYDLMQKLDEDVIWSQALKPFIKDLPKNVVDMWGYCTTEIINNAIDHAGGTTLEIYIKRFSHKVNILIRDDGEGIFKKIQRSLGLLDERQALFELKKGKLTTDRERHSGQGIFFTSRMCDDFAILSDKLVFLHTDKNEQDWLSKGDNTLKGTAVYLEIENTTQKTAKDVHDQYSSDDDSYQFSKTVVPVRLASEGEGLVSRSQAKRLLLRVDNFQTVILDFDGVEEVGQGFADEIFRVFAKQHPAVKLYPLNTNDAVSKMIARALLTRDD